MIDMDPEVRRARDLSRDAAVDLRSRALAIDTDPDAMDAHLGSPAFAMIRRSTTPVEFREPDPDGLPALPDRGSCLQGVVGFLELARGDVAAVLACPSPALAGVFVELLGNREQKQRFYSRLHGGRTWTFFAMTEPGHGNDATAMETRLDKDGSGGWLLYGSKPYIANRAPPGIGTLFPHTHP